jgi:membrane-bound lytic murein transglycosylase A
MLAQDEGAAIKGPLRADVFWGVGPAAEVEAGAMKSPGRLYLLLPASLQAGS